MKPASLESGVPGLLFDPEALLVREPRVLLDPRFLGALHAELEDELGSEPAITTLLQIGFLHGLRDALRAAGQLAQAEDEGALAVLPSPLPTRLRAASRRGHPARSSCTARGPNAAKRRRIWRASGRSAQCACAVSAGYTSGWLSGLFDADIAALETSCGATGDAECCFVAREAEAWRAAPDAERRSPARRPALRGPARGDPQRARPRAGSRRRAASMATRR